MKMKKRKRLYTPIKNRKKHPMLDFERDEEVSSARGRLKGALLDALENTVDNSESETSTETTPVKRERRDSDSSEEKDETPKTPLHVRPPYVLKLFDRSVDLSQFEEDSPLYPICRAWMLNQPKSDYSQYEQKYKAPAAIEDSIDLPGPEGPTITRIPELLPEQKQRNKNNINLDYTESPPPSKEQLLKEHVSRWANIRAAWLQQAALAEKRYSTTQELLDKINVSSM